MFVVGTHRDEEHKCSEKRKDKDEIIRNVPTNPDFLITLKLGNEIIWEINGKAPEPKDEKVAYDLKKAIVTKCKSETKSPLLIRWFGLEMQIRVSDKHGVLSLSTCLSLARKLDMDEQGLEAALLHIVKYNQFLWYHDIPALREVVFSDPQVILKIITDLVQCKHEVDGDVAPQSFSSGGVKHTWSINLKRGIVSHEFLSSENFKKLFVDDIFTVEHFTTLMCHCFIMVPLKERGDYVMPALLDPLSPDTFSVGQS